MINTDLTPDWQTSQWFNTIRPPTPEGLRGKVVLLHAFQMLCPGCVSHSIPQAESVHRQYAAAGVVVIGLHTVFEHHAAMTPLALEAFLHEYRITHPVGVDIAGVGSPIPQTMNRYQMNGTPTLILIDRTGRLRLHEFGRVDDLRLGVLLGQLLSEDSAMEQATSIQRHQTQRDDGCDADGCAVQVRDAQQ